MPAERYFINDNLSISQHVMLTGAELKHLQVMRPRIGEQVEIVNGRGVLAWASVESIRKDSASLLVTDVVIKTSRPHSVILAQGMPKLNHLDFILEKGTELGVDEFWLFPAQRSIKKEVSASQIDRFTNLLIAAMKQCGRLFLPRIHFKPELKKWPDILEGTAFFGSTDPGSALFAHVWQELPLHTPFIFFVGPESGFSLNEIQELTKRNAYGVKLHTNILRTETASLVALSLIEHWLLNLSS